MALDEPKEDDEIFEKDGFKLVMNKKQLAQAGGISIDYLDGPFRKGFQLKADNQRGC